MKRRTKTEGEILRQATTLVAKEFGIEQSTLKLSYKHRNGIFFTFQFTSRETAYLPVDKTSYCVTINVAGAPVDLYKN